MPVFATPVRILIVGGGYVGMYTALGLQKKLGPSIAKITVVEPQPNMTYQPFLPEAAAGSLEPRHVVVSLRRMLRRCSVVTGSVTKIEHERRTAFVQPNEGKPYEMVYDLLVVCPGSVSRLLPVPGLAERGIGFKTIGEAIFLRNHVLSRLDLAASTQDPGVRRAALTFVFVGGGYAGVEAIAELEDMARHALRYYDDIEPADLRWVLVEAADRILPEVSLRMASYAASRLAERGIDIRLNTRLESCVDGHVVLSDAVEVDAETVVWTAGVKANPMLANTDLPRDHVGRVLCKTDLSVKGTTNAFAAGDCAAVRDLAQRDPNALCSPSAQHAVRQAKTLVHNISATVQGGRLRQYKHRYVGSVASLGLYRGVAEVFGVRVGGFPAWWMHRTYHMLRMPTINRKARVISDWTEALLFRRDVVSLGQLQQPRTQFEAAADDATRVS